MLESNDISFRVLLRQLNSRHDAMRDEARERIAGCLAVALVAGMPFYFIFAQSGFSLVEASEAAEPLVRIEEFDRHRPSREAAPHALDAREVRAIQVLLQIKGFDPGPVDGIAGKRTLTALNAYRQSLGLSHATAVNSETIAALVN